MKKLLFIIGACAALVFGALSCSVEEHAAALMLGRSTQALVYLDGRATAEDEFEFSFSRPVSLTSINFTPSVNIDSIENGSTVKVKLAQKLMPGMLLTVDLLAEDENRNSINVLAPIRSRNNRMPKMVINEFRTEYASSAKRVEFIEFVMKSAGNLGAMRVFMASGSQKPIIFEFDPVEVKIGEFVVLHLRKIEDDCKDEYGGNLAESGGTDALPTARDFWISPKNKAINKTGFIYVLNQDDSVLDAVMFSENPDNWWGKDYLAEAAEFLYEKGAWKSANGSVCAPADAIITADIKSSATRSLSRDETVEDSNTALDWYVTATSAATPGKSNDPRR